MFKQITAIALLALATLQVVAQETFKFGNVDTHSIITQMPAFDAAQKQIKSTATSYEEELKRMSSEYSDKYHDYLVQRDTLPQLLQERRMQEIVALEQQIEQVRMQAQQELSALDSTLIAPLKAQVVAAVERLGKKHKYTAIIDLSASQPIFAPYCGAKTYDITPQLKKDLGIE